MSIAGSRVGIVGGSIAGCAAAIALGRAGCEVTVLERSSSALRDRGAGIAIPHALRQELTVADYLDADYPFWPSEHRLWVIKDGDEPTGRLLWRQRADASLNNWSILWRALRSRVEDASYHDGRYVVRIENSPSGVVVALDDGSREQYDLVVGADGYRSTIRATLYPQSKPDFAGYVLWRGNYPESRLVDRAPLDLADADHSWFTVCFPEGHGVFYMIPGSADRADVGHRRVNWAVYTPTPDTAAFDSPGSVFPGDLGDMTGILDEYLDRYFPPWLASVIRLSDPDEVSIQPIYDDILPSYVADRVLLLGDASTVTRPHTGSGATKALQDAIALQRIARAADSWEEVLAAYDDERAAAGNTLVDLGKRIGRAQVEHTPDWASMTPADFEAWTAATLSGESLYFYGEDEDPD
jgi:2-polyprenyl-6-methoxyphenol hydroxylase-like FAD-dependent oxidoreductase